MCLPPQALSGGILQFVYTRRRRLFASILAGIVLVAGCTDPTEDEQPTRSERMSVSVERALRADSKFDAVRVVLVSADGKPLVEHYSGTSPEEYHPVMSVTKSVLSTAVGIAIEDGRFIEEEDPGGLDFAMAPDAVAAALATGHGAKSAFGYSSAGVQLISAALAEATGDSVLDFSRTVLFDPLTVDTEPAMQQLAVPANLPEYLAADFAWRPVDRQGVQQGWSFLKLRPRDMQAFGQLILDHGEWHDDQVVPENWVHEATSAQVEVDDRTSYGYLWWRTTLAGHDAIAALGYGGQSVIIVPDLDLVAVTVTELAKEDLHSDISPINMLNVVESAVAVGYGRR